MTKPKDPARSFFTRRARSGALFATLAVLAVVTTGAAEATLTVTPITWNVIGLDSNAPATGPYRFPVGARVCSVGGAASGITATMSWDSANANVDFRPGSLTTVPLPDLGSGGCADAYFEVQVNQVPAAYDTARRYHIDATSTTPAQAGSTPTPRQLYVEHLISQNRNAITDVKYGPVSGPLASVPAGGAMALVVGSTYKIELDGGTATQGYNQFEAFINFPNTIFQILGVNTTYSADNSPYVPNPNDELYADACQWQNDPNAPTYGISGSCIGGDFKAGGSSVVTTYTIKIIGGGGTSQTLNTLLYDFSGSSFHYNSDFSAAARIAAIVDPAATGISKAFNPSSTNVNGVSTLAITISNSNGVSLGGFNFTDPLPAGMSVANPPAASTSGCGSPTFAPTAGATTLSFSTGTVAANGSCTISVNVTANAANTYVNTTNHLFVDANDTGHFGTASLTVTNAPPPPPCTPGLELARWTMAPAQGTATPPAPSFQSALVATASAGYTGSGTNAVDATQGNPVNSWSGTGWAPNGTGFPSATTPPYFEFTLDTSKFTNVAMGVDIFGLNGDWASAGNNILYLYSSADGGAFGTTYNAAFAKGSWNSIPATAAATTGTSTTAFRLNASGAQTTAKPLFVDNVIFTGCGVPAFPTLAKAFAPNPIAVNAVSTLTFTLTNGNSVALTGAAFTDALPSGVQVAATPAAATTCAGATWAPAAGNTTLTFSGGTIPAAGSCTAQVNVTATTAGPHQNVSGYISTTQTGTNSGPGGSGSAGLTAVLPPAIAKLFEPNPVLPGGVSTLTFTITNPNVSNAVSGVAFADGFPTSPGAMVVAAVPSASTSGCGAPTFAPAAGAGSISFTGGSIAAGGTCLVSVNVTVPVTGTYNNTSGNVSHIVNGTPVNGNTASASLVANPPHPSIGLLKQVGATPTGPWFSYLQVSNPPTASVYYQFTIENTGDVPLSPVTIADNTLNVGGCTPTLPGTLPVAVAANNNHIATCVVGPVAVSAGSHTNTAHATGTYGGTPYNSLDDSATYATTGLTLVKTPDRTYFNTGETIGYTYLVTNSGSAPLAAPVTVSDDKTTVSCPAVSTVGDLDDWLDPGEQITCTASYITSAGDGTSVVNVATAHAGGADSNTEQKTVLLTGTPVELQSFSAE